VCSFDKRGVGRSTGRWQDADIIEQARDVTAVAQLVTAEGLVSSPVGLFGHSQGGWVVIEAASRDNSFEFVVTNSGPGVSPAAQVRYATLCDMKAAGMEAEEIDETIGRFDMAISVMRDEPSFELALVRIEEVVRSRTDLESLLRFLLVDAGEWRFASGILDYDPRPSMAKIRVPVLAIFGGDDVVVPVNPSVRALQESVRYDLLRVEVFEGADHRIRDRQSASFTDGYLQTLSSYIADPHASHDTR
jgi:pimeloyl-ACP methyl ester carboxylesterase